MFYVYAGYFFNCSCLFQDWNEKWVAAKQTYFLKNFLMWESSLLAAWYWKEQLKNTLNIHFLFQFAWANCCQPIASTKVLVLHAASNIVVWQSSSATTNVSFSSFQRRFPNMFSVFVWVFSFWRVGPFDLCINFVTQRRNYQIIAQSRFQIWNWYFCFNGSSCTKRQMRRIFL